MRSLYARLTVVLALLFLFLGTVYFVGALYSAHMYQQEVSQRLNQDLAGYIAREHKLLENGQVRKVELEHLFHDLMIINPSIELYLLARDGKILGYSAAPGQVQEQHVSLVAIRKLMESHPRLPILGDDPRNPGVRKAFSAAPIGNPDQPDGFIYAILGSQKFDKLTAMLQGSYILRWSSMILSGALLFSLVAGASIFALLTRRLRRLEKSMTKFRIQEFTAPPELFPEPARNGDEIDRIGSTYLQMANRIRAQVNQLKDTDSLRRELVANVSHDLRTPLASLKGYLETLIIKENQLSHAERKAYLETATRHADRLSRLIEELFELAKLDAKEVQPNPETFSVAELAHDVAQKFSLRAEQQNATISIDVNPDIPDVKADIGMIERVLDNLIDNALQHVADDGQIRISMEAGTDGRVNIEIIDNGRGIPGEDLPHIFERFYRKVSGKSGGAGLGLAIAQRIVELHNSHLSVSSTINQGSRFGFALPATGR